ncbi:hypothetical protein [Clostridium kluyveri]|nr:hypothetical protein [Clostridium kluyveri]
MFLVIWGITILAKKAFSIKKYILLGIIMGVIAFFTRNLPIYFGVHTIIILIFTIIIMIIAGIPIITSIYSTLIMSLILSLSEFLNIFVLNFFNIDTSIDIVNINPIKKCLLGIPSLIILFLVIIILHYILKRGEKIKNVSD